MRKINKRVQGKQLVPEPAKQVRPIVPYWEDPVYRCLAGLHRVAQTSGNNSEVARLAELLQKVADKSLADEIYFKLDAERKVIQKKTKLEQKKQQKGMLVSSKLAVQSQPSVNIIELKKRIFNPQTSPQNMIKALEALPVDERKKTVSSLTSFLRGKITKYLQSKGY